MLTPRGVLHQFLQSYRVSYLALLLHKYLLFNLLVIRLFNLQDNLRLGRLCNLQSSRVQNHLDSHRSSPLGYLPVNRFVILLLFHRLDVRKPRRRAVTVRRI